MKIKLEFLYTAESDSSLYQRHVARTYQLPLRPNDSVIEALLQFSLESFVLLQHNQYRIYVPDVFADTPTDAHLAHALDHARMGIENELSIYRELLNTAKINNVFSLQNVYKLMQQRKPVYRVADETYLW